MHVSSLIIIMQAMLFEINQKIDAILNLLQGASSGAAIKEENADFMVNGLM
jgi:hypothetical protein